MIVTFYSYKGGTGRTMALANIAVLLAKAGRRVLMVDFDLEAPGVWRYFADLQGGLDRRDGLLDLLEAHARGTESRPPDWRRYTTTIGIGVHSVSLLASGRQDTDYPARVLSFDWQAFFGQHNGGQFLEQLRDDWLDEYDFVLIDSRTGITDIGGICTIALPDLIVPVFVANSQNVDGVVDVLRRAQAGRQALAYDRAPALVLPLLSRFDSRTELQFVNEWLSIAAHRFGEFYADWLPRRIDPRVVLERTKLPHVAYFGFGEKLAVLLQGVTDPDSLGFALNSVATLIDSKLADLSKVVPETAPPGKSADRATSLGPAHDSWIAAVHDGPEIVGTAIVVDRLRLLTAAHLAKPGLSVSFPKASDDRRYRVNDVRVSDDPARYDVAVLYLTEPIPSSVSPAPLSFVAPGELVGTSWWSFGFPPSSRFGAVYHGTVDASLSYGWLRLNTAGTGSVGPGFSGAAVWSPEHQAVVGLIGAADGDGHGLALPLHRVDAALRSEQLRMLADPAVGANSIGPHQREELVEVLSRVVDTEPSAVRLLDSIGFPRSRMPNYPAYSSAELFWERIVTELENGILESGVGRLVEALYREYPGNRALHQIAASLGSPVEPAGP